METRTGEMSRKISMLLRQMYGFYKSKMCLRTASLQNITVNLDLEEAKEIKKLPSLASSNDDFVMMASTL